MLMIVDPLFYGDDGRFACRLSADRISGLLRAPEPLPDLRARTAAALESSIDFPALRQCVFPGDRIVLVIDPHTPGAAEILVEVWSVFAGREVQPGDVKILLPADLRGERVPDPRTLLPAQARASIRFHVHDPTKRGGCGYLAATAAGERLYLSKEVLDADMVISIGAVEFDPLLGYRGTHSAFYPGLSDVDAIRKAHGQGHDELTHDDSRPLRQTVDEVGWLLGSQYSIQVIPSRGAHAAEVIAGQAEAVLAQGKQLLASDWTLEVSERPELAVVAVDAGPQGQNWNQLAAALDLARQLVVRDGRVLVLTELSQLPSDGIRLISDSPAPRDALKPLRDAAPPDLIAATQIAKALDWMNVYLLSRLDGQLVEDLFMIPLASQQEAARVIEGSETCVIVEGAQHAAVRIAQAP